jgi:hypothetical protein
MPCFDAMAVREMGQNLFPTTSPSSRKKLIYESNTHTISEEIYISDESE